jgi:hypothetical protein
MLQFDPPITAWRPIGKPIDETSSKDKPPLSKQCADGLTDEPNLQDGGAADEPVGNAQAAVGLPRAE